MKWVYRIVRTILVSSLFLAVGIPIFLYLVLWLEPIQQKVRTVAQSELSNLLGADVYIGKLEIQPFTRINLSDVSISEGEDTVVRAEALNATLSGRGLLRGHIVVNGVELMSPEIRMSRDSAGTPLNIQPILDKLKGDGNKEPSKFNLGVGAIVIRGGIISYDVLNAPHKSESFDANHIGIENFSADLTAPIIRNGNIKVSLKRLTARERSGLYLRNLAATAELTDSLLSIKGLTLKLNNTALSFADMKVNLYGSDITMIELLSGSSIYPVDLSAIHPSMASLVSPLKVEARVELMRDSLVIRKFDIHTPGHELFADTRGKASRRAACAHSINLGVKGEELVRSISLFAPLKPNAATLLANLGNISFAGTASWRNPLNVNLAGILATDMGIIDIDAKLADRRLSGVVETDAFELDRLLQGKELGTGAFGATFDISKNRGHAAVSIEHLTWRNHDYKDINLQGDYSGKSFAAIIEADDSLMRGNLTLTADLTPGAFAASVDGDVSALASEAVGLVEKYPGHVLSGQIKGNFNGDEPLRPTGQLMVSNLRFLDVEGQGLREAPIVLTSDFTSSRQQIRLQSDLIDADISGQINLRTVVHTVNNLLATALPQYFSPQPTDSTHVNDFTLHATVKNDAPLLSFLPVPVQMLYPATLNATLNNTEGMLNFTAPYLRKGNSLISHIKLNGRIGEESWIAGGAVMPSKFGDINLTARGTLSGNTGNINLAFDNNATPRFGGDFKVRVKPLYDGLDANILSSSLNLGGVEWNVEPAYIGLRNGTVIVHGFGLNHPGQELTINGVASKFAEDRLIVKLDNINIDYIFQTLRLPETLQFGGDATGTVTASALLSPEPILQTDDLYVKGLKYGGCVMGNGNIRSRWNNESRGIELYADVDDSAHGGSTTVDGKIFIIDKKLDFVFTANHSPASFLHTFMKTWAANVGGTASGRLHLFGDFKHVDLEGEAAAENFFLTIGYTGVTYYASDTIKIRPGVIDLSNITVRDRAGNEATLNGRLNHKHFKDVDFRFVISDIDKMLVLDTEPTPDNDRWYGTIYANGTAEITGQTGLVKIKADAVTAPGSDFTFALTNAQSAAEYTFLTFRDITPRKPDDTDTPGPGPELDRQMRARLARSIEEEELSNFRIELHVDATPATRMNLIMDPTAGDKITGIGSGHIDITYGSDTDEMRLYGDYKIDKGEYNFSLQDIILKTFTIRDGSEITFHGDPMEAALNISAYNKVNANLSDLDESFLNDKEVQRTTVPVHAVLNVDGYLQDPHISFDIDLPTLTSDVKRKVKSIISTDDMMNRQIIYLLALNRFYTPEYMAATKGNDLMSVASGTISSQLSNILGQLSDKISIAPSLRTESEDFSDMEFDVALSSTLLNNRLLLNGNFGYRDKSMNNNQFIGDFDIEYLLTRRGNWRLKAYNHFNDRNLYMKQALTTQGLGLVYKLDFD